MTWPRELFIPGVPAPQGSKRHVGGGRLIESSKHVGPWRDTVTARIMQAGWHETPLLTGPVFVYCTFYLPRPKAHIRADGDVKPTAPDLCATRPDIDKLLRAVLDAVTNAGAIRDDAQITNVQAWKEYASTPGVNLIVGVDG